MIPMTLATGVVMAFVAMFGWGIGDFMVQRNTRKLGDMETLFILGTFGAVVLLPFVHGHIGSLFIAPAKTQWILVSAGVLLLGSTLLNFEAFKRGKISVLEPLYSIEILAAALMAYLILGDSISWIATCLILFLVVCLFMVSFREQKLSHRIFMEKGVIMFAVGAFFLGFADFLIGWGARVTDPLLAMWVSNVIITVGTGLYLLSRGRMLRMCKDVWASKGFLLGMSIAENVAWVAYAMAMSLAPIAIATGLTESSVIIAVLLGIILGKERLQRHQKIGLVGAIAATIALALSTAG